MTHGGAASEATQANGEGRGAAGRDDAKVAAVVVTYNRKQLLVPCLDAVLGQTRPVDRLIVVDNCSTDGTPEFLAERGYLRNPAFEYVRLPENTGSAGGFHEGMKRAYEQGFDWLWMMDDDGLPLPGTLARLLECPTRILFRGCVVLNSEGSDHQMLAFALDSPFGPIFTTRELARISGPVLEGCVTPFNGVLVSRAVVARIGLPKKEMFIWGEETEYFLRAKRHGISAATVVEAKFMHPKDRMMWRRVKAGPVRFALPFAEDPRRLFLIVRNQTYLSMRHRGLFSRGFLKLAAYPILFPSNSGLILRAWFEGVSGKLRGDCIPDGFMARRRSSPRQ